MMNEHSDSRQVTIMPMAIMYFSMFVLAILVNHYRANFLFPEYRPGWARVLVSDVVFGLSCGFVVVLISALLNRYVSAFKELGRSFRALLGPISKGDVFFMAAFSALGEEFFFRGLIQGEFGLWVASIGFGLLHIGPGKKFLPWTIFALSLIHISEPTRPY